ncbi:MAG: SLBB domain-containing protein, partial [Lachnospiraceae bacterium]|nr:SLBB domain-containing protein [Lachnospiraceae bacterium]
MTELQEGTGSETVSVVRELETPPEFSETVNVRRYVYVTGAVAHEGVYEVSETTRVFEVLELAGGALPEADLSGVNQADRVYDGMHLR